MYLHNFNAFCVGLFFFPVNLPLCSFEPVRHLTAFCSWPCRALWEICPAGSLPWCIDIWQAHTCRRNRLKVRACRRRWGSGGGCKHDTKTRATQINAVCLLWLFWPQCLAATAFPVLYVAADVWKPAIVSFLLGRDEGMAVSEGV